VKTYVVAGRHVRGGQVCPYLGAFETTSSSPSPPGGCETKPREARAKLLYQGPGWVAGGLHQVECTLSDQGFRLEIAGVGVFRVAPDGSSFCGTDTDPDVDPEHLSQTAVGPPLVLALALQDAFCLHASAVTDGRSAVAFVGRSGTGKSSLAYLLATQPGLGWMRLADDVLAVEESARWPIALPRFPQLKLEAREQPWLDQPERLPLAAAYLLDRPTARVELRPLSPRDAAVALMHHTVAARLFSPALVERHLDFCARIAEQIPVSRLSYPWRLDVAPEISRALAARSQR